MERTVGAIYEPPKHESPHLAREIVQVYCLAILTVTAVAGLMIMWRILVIN